MIKQLYNKVFNNKFSKDSLWILISQFFLAINGIILNVFISNYFSSTDLGVFNQALAFFLIFASFSNIGIFNTTVKYISESSNSKTKTKQVLESSLQLVLIFSLICFFSVKIILSLNQSIFSSKELEKAIGIIVFATPGFAINRVFIAYFNGVRNMKIYSMIRIFRWGGYIFIIMILSVLFNEFYTILYAFIITEYLILIYCTVRYKSLISFRVNYLQIKKNFSFGSKSFLSEIVSDSQDRLDIIIIGYLLTDADVGLYSFAAAIAKGVLLIPAVFMQNINPIISNLWKKNQLSEINLYIVKLKKISFKIMLPFVLLTFVCYLVLLYFFMTKEYHSTVTIFSIMLAGSFIVSLIYWSGGFLLMAGKLYSNLAKAIMLLIISILLNLIGVYYFGLLGSAISYFLFCLLVVFINNFFIERYMNLSLFRKI